MNRIALSFDIELQCDLPKEFDTNKDFSSLTPSIGALAYYDSPDGDTILTEFFYDEPYMTRETAKKLVNRMVELVEKDGLVISGWNTVGFDFPLLASYSGMYGQCAELALNSIDLMLMVVFRNGCRAKLDSALKAMGLEGKLHEAILNNGDILTDMSGEKAPGLWRSGEREVVKKYLEKDVTEPLKLTEIIKEEGKIRWISKAGRLTFCEQKLIRTKNLFSIPLPDTSWMSEPPRREEAFEWMPQSILNKYNIPVKEKELNIK